MVVWDDLGSISLLLIRFLQFVFNIRVATMKPLDCNSPSFRECCSIDSPIVTMAYICASLQLLVALRTSTVTLSSARSNVARLILKGSYEFFPKSS
jgi:hypothetical protein